MTKEVMLDIICEMIVIDSEEGLIENCTQIQSDIIVTTSTNEVFKVTVEKM